MTADFEGSLGRGAAQPTQDVSQGDRLPRYRHPVTEITVIDVHRRIDPNKTQLIPILPSNPTVEVIK
jgi:hypothetical protein